MTTPAIIITHDRIVDRLRKYAAAFGAPEYARVQTAASFQRAVASKIDRPAAFVRFDGILPTSADVVKITDGPYQQTVTENWQIIILTDEQKKDDSGTLMQKQAIECMESIIRAVVNWSPDDDTPGLQPGERRRPPAQIETGFMTDDLGDILAAFVNLRFPQYLVAADGYTAEGDDINEIRASKTGGATVTKSTDPPAPATPASNYSAISNYGEIGNADRRNYTDNKELRAALTHESGITIRSDGGFQFPDANTPGMGLILPLAADDLTTANPRLVLSFIARRGATAAFQTVLQALAGVYDGGDSDILQFTGSSLTWEGNAIADQNSRQILLDAATELTISVEATLGTLAGNKRNVALRIAVSGGGASWNGSGAGSFYEFGANRPFAQFGFGGQGSHSFDGYIKNIKIARIAAALSDDELTALTPNAILA